MRHWGWGSARGRDTLESACAACGASGLGGHADGPPLRAGRPALRPHPHPPPPALCLPARVRRLQQDGEAEVRAAQDALSELDAQGAAVEGDIREKEDEIAGLQVGGGCRRSCGCLEGG